MKANAPIRSVWARWILLGWLLLIAAVVGQEELYSESALQAMPDEELELMCVSRGFELVKGEIDPTTGLAYELTHDDYVEAAQRCLAIEQEMNELLDQYPELADELEEEIKKMEEEQAARQAEVDQLQSELSEAEKATTEESPGTAFVPKPQVPKDEEDDFEILDEEPVQEATAEQATIDDTDEEEEPILSESKEAEQPASTATNKDLESTQETTSKEDLTMRALTFEIVRSVLKQANSDVKRIVELLAPVIRPILQAGDTAWRTIRATLMTMHQNYQSSRNNEEAEGCVDEAE